MQRESTFRDGQTFQRMVSCDQNVVSQPPACHRCKLQEPIVSGRANVRLRSFYVCGR